MPKKPGFVPTVLFALVIAIAVVLIGINSNRGTSDRTPDMEWPAVKWAGEGPSPAAGSPATVLDFTFKTGDYTIHPLEDDEVLFASDVPIDLAKDVPLDSLGVRQYVGEGGDRFDHPVAQAQYGLELMNGWVVRADDRYLRRAIANGQRLIENAVEVGGAWFHPYPFDFALHGLAQDTLKAPWYSAMAQGEALALFTRLYRATGDDRWESAARHTFESLTMGRDGTQRPWVVDVDSDGYLWFEEYASERPDRTFNGHMFAILGLAEYSEISDDPRVTQLISGGLEMVKKYAPEIRVPGGVSRYCLAHEVYDEKYHMVHIAEFDLLLAYTRDPIFRQLATDFRSDFSLE